LDARALGRVDHDEAGRFLERHAHADRLLALGDVELLELGLVLRQLDDQRRRSDLDVDRARGGVTRRAVLDRVDVDRRARWGRLDLDLARFGARDTYGARDEHGG